MSRESPTATATTGCATAQRLPLALKTMYALSAINLTSLEPFATRSYGSLYHKEHNGASFRLGGRGNEELLPLADVFEQSCNLATSSFDDVVARSQSTGLTVPTRICLKRCCQIAIDGVCRTVHCSNSDRLESRRATPKFGGGGVGPEDNTANVPTSAERIM